VPPKQIHVLSRISGVTFNEALEGHVPSVYGTVSVRYIGRAPSFATSLRPRAQRTWPMWLRFSADRTRSGAPGTPVPSAGDRDR
jgi:hypothetical protein